MKEYVHEYCNTEDGHQPERGLIEQTIAGQLEFNRGLLVGVEENPRVTMSTVKGHTLYQTYRNLMGANVDIHGTDLQVQKTQLYRQIVRPSLVGMTSRAPLRTQDYRGFAGYTECAYFYENTSMGHRLDQRVVALHMPSSASPLFETVAVERFVLDDLGDCTYAHVIFNDTAITDRLGVQPIDGEPVSLSFTPHLVLATTIGSVVLNEFSYRELKHAGLTASFHDDRDRATFSIAGGDMSFQLRLGKRLRPGYPALMFSGNEEWITDSGIMVGSVPKETLN